MPSRTRRESRRRPKQSTEPGEDHEHQGDGAVVNRVGAASPTTSARMAHHRHDPRGIRARESRADRQPGATSSVATHCVRQSPPENA